MNELTEADYVQARKDAAEETKDLPRRRDALGRMVPEKKANKPYFVYQDYKRKQAELEAAKAERQKIRAEKIARGEEVGPDPDEEKPSAAGTIIKIFVIGLLMTLYAGYFVMGDPFWGSENKWLTAKHWASFIPDGTQKMYSESQLATYDGTDPEKPVFLAIDGIVYDVSEGRRTYGPGGSYHQFAGRDAARAFVTGCFKEHLTHDIRGFGENEMKVRRWFLHRFWTLHACCGGAA
ncbi:hypothetical protein M407DRAFT_205977 [Tulasnella calospora MUT 4182]|uniref:Cytochrome b5 heme-binding domain-containing protein n=1 Tax=Tulasnella calospora MUT 4182 TaxID=1051891 RepID=A0A0C3Q0X8_9AGAM|nr:hypothetical protein M407DRAFT_205977 [Tulasnella calospora MUT 4182]